MYCTKERFSSKFDFSLYKGLLLILIMTLLPLSSSVYGQKRYEEGNVVLKSQDTLYGKIRDRKPHPFGSLYKKIKFKGKRGKSKYSPKEILAYKKGGSFFESMWVEDSGRLFDQNFIAIEGSGRPVFLKVVEKGFVTYYHWEFEDADSGYLDYIGYFKKEDNQNLIRVSQGLFGLRRKALASFFNDCPELALSIKEKQIKDPIEIIRFYNNWKAGNP